MKTNKKAQKAKPMVRKGWVVRITDANGIVYFPIFKDLGNVDIERQDDYYNDVIPHTTIFGLKDVAKSRVKGVRKAAIDKAASTYLTRPTLPIKVEVVRFFRQIG